MFSCEGRPVFHCGTKGSQSDLRAITGDQREKEISRRNNPANTLCHLTSSLDNFTIKKKQFYKILRFSLLLLNSLKKWPTQYQLGRVFRYWEGLIFPREQEHFPKFTSNGQLWSFCKTIFFLDMIASLAPTPQAPKGPVYQLYWTKDFVSPFIRKQVFVASHPEDFVAFTSESNAE